MLVRRSCFVALSLAGLASCRSPADAPRRVVLDFVVESDPGVGLAGALVVVEGERVGQSDSNGFLRASVDAVPGSLIRIEHDCPEGYADPPEAEPLRMRDYEVVGPASPSPMEITLKCRPQKRVGAFVVRARNGFGLPVLLNGEVVAVTNSSGVAHFSSSAPAGSEYVVQIDTTRHPRILPRSPTRLFTLPDHDEVFVVDQSFELAKRSGPQRRGRARITKIE
jgi:hypothetical protein